jgi:regulator of cell morphogenesis and NO signaling
MILLEKKLKDIILDSPGLAEIMERYKLDYCCHGNRTLAEAIEAINLSAEAIEKELLESINSDTCFTYENYGTYSLNQLIDHIVSTHHHYINKMTPILSDHTRKISRIHGENHNELLDVVCQFELLKNDLISHMAKEEQILFPYIVELEKASLTNCEMSPSNFGTIENPIRMMEDEHKAVGDILATLSELTNNYNPPEYACTTYKLAFLELKDFEENLHQHIHLENNLLFPKAIELEKNKSYARS